MGPWKLPTIKCTSSGLTLVSLDKIGIWSYCIVESGGDRTHQSKVWKYIPIAAMHSCKLHSTYPQRIASYIFHLGA